SFYDAAGLLDGIFGCDGLAAPLEGGHAACSGCLERIEHFFGIAPFGGNAVQTAWEAERWCHVRLRLKIRAPMPGWNTRPPMPLAMLMPYSVARGTSVPRASSAAIAVDNRLSVPSAGSPAGLAH